jgi:hypothetical protein
MDRPQPTREALRAFAQRRWDLIERGKREFLAERYRDGGPMAARAAAARLLDRWRALHPDAPLPSMRAADLEAHVAFARKLDKARHGLRRR